MRQGRASGWTQAAACRRATKASGKTCFDTIARRIIIVTIERAVYRKTAPAISFFRCPHPVKEYEVSVIEATNWNRTNRHELFTRLRPLVREVCQDSDGIIFTLLRI